MSLRSIKSGATGITEAGVLQFITDLLAQSGVFDILAGQFKVTAGTGLAVNVAAGRAYLLNPGGNGYPIINDSQITNLAINANSSGNPRITSIVLYKNIGASPNVDDTNTNFVVSIDGTPAASPNPPTSGQITAITGANPYIILANVTVNSGASSPSSIDNTPMPQVKFRTDIFNADAWVPVAAAVGGTTYLDLSLGKKFQVNMGAGNTTFALKNVPLNCKSIDVRITQDSGGNRTITWWANLSWPNASAPTLTVTANKSDEFGINFLSVTNDTTNTSEGFVMGQNI